MKKKIFSVMLVAALAASLLAGCGKNKDTNKKQTEVTEATEVVNTKTVSADGIKITGSMDSAEKVEMSAVTDGDDYKAATDYIATLGKNITATEVYNINLLDKDSKKVQPDSKVNINLTLSDNMVNAEGDGYEVYRKESNNTFTSLKSTIVDKEISFNTEHFSIYVVVKTSNAPIENTESTESTEVQAEPQVEPQTTEPEQQSTYSYTDKSATMYAQRSVNVRDLPDTNGNKVGGLSTNQEVSVTGQCNETGWYRISYNGGTAYVSNNYLGDSKVETKKNTNSSNSSQPNSNAGTSSGNSESNSTASSGNSVSALNSCPYTLNKIYDDGGDYVYYYYVDTVDSMHGAAKEAMYAKGFDDNNIIWSYEDIGTFSEGHVLKCTMKNGTW